MPNKTTTPTIHLPGTVPASTTTSSQVTVPMPVTPTSSPIAVPAVPSVTAAPSAPTATAPPVVLSTTPPVVGLPAIPTDFTVQNPVDFRGRHPTNAQVAAAPDAAAEVAASTTYATTFGPAMPEAKTYAQNLRNAMAWSALRATIEAFATYVKTNEAVTWKAVLIETDQAKAVYDVTAVKNSGLAQQFPALTRLIEARDSAAGRAAATRKRNKAAKAATAASSTSARAGQTVAGAAPATTTAASAGATVAPTAAVIAGANGGGAH